MLIQIQAGGVAGTAVDLLFFPIDTIKTRLQSSQGFVNTGGFRGIYKGVGSVIVGSSPGGIQFWSLVFGQLDISSCPFLCHIRNNEESITSSSSLKPHGFCLDWRSCMYGLCYLRVLLLRLLPRLRV